MDQCNRIKKTKQKWTLTRRNRVDNIVITMYVVQWVLDLLGDHYVSKLIAFS